MGRGNYPSHGRVKKKVKSETLDLDRNLDPERVHKLDLSLDIKPPIDLRSWPAWNENTEDTE